MVTSFFHYGGTDYNILRLTIELEKKMLHIENMNSKQLDELISEYNWDDGFIIPYVFITDICA